MKRRLINAVCILLLLSSAVFLLMPHVSREITKKDMDDKISRFETAVSNTETLPDEDDETASDSQNSPSGEVYSEEGVTTPIDVNKLYEDSTGFTTVCTDTFPAARSDCICRSISVQQMKICHMEPRT